MKTVMIISSGPIVIGQGCEFDYSGTQACKALREEGIRIVLLNSNPATIMTDPELADRTYIEPITPETIEKVLAREAELGTPVDSLLPTLGGQTGLNCAVKAADLGILERHKVRLIGANRDAIHKAEDRTEFKNAMIRIGLDVPNSGIAHTWEESQEVIKKVGLPVAIRPAYTLGGTGGGFAFNMKEFETICKRGLEYSLNSEILIEESCLGWKEYELEVMRDRADNVVIICSIENFDPMGVHTGDSITVAPAQTLTDKEYQLMRDAAIKIIREIGVDTGGSNIQFAVHPETGRMIVIEMNPRVSRSSALASKATGYPIARIAAKLAIGYTLDEIPNDITKKTPASFEPTIDYCVVKIPRWTFEKFPEADETLTTQMKSVGEAMAIGRTFVESLQKAIRSMEVKRFGLGLDKQDAWLQARQSSKPEKQQSSKSEGAEWPVPEEKLIRKLAVPSQGRLYFIRYAMKMGWSDARIFELSKIDPFFLDQIRRLVEFEDVLCSYARLQDVPQDVMFRAKQMGYSDAQLACLYLGAINPDTILRVRAFRKSLGVEPVYKLVDTCAAEFEAVTPYYYSTYETPVGTAALRAASGGSQAAGPDGRHAHAEDEIRVSDKKKVIILGGGPNRIGQGIEFDYCCVHASFAARELGFESVMINSNPETVSTDYDTSDLLFFEPLTLEDVLNVVERLGTPPRRGAAPGVLGLIVQFGGQTPLNLAKGLVAAGAPIIGTSVDSIDLAEDRDRFDALLNRLGLHKPPSGIARSLDEAVAIANRIGYPVLVRPSYVLGGRGMEICSDEKSLKHYMTNAVNISELDGAPVLIDRFLDDATEVDVDVIADYETDGDKAHGPEARATVCGVMEHIEQAGIHSGDSACSLPPWSLPRSVVDRIKEIGRTLARELRVRGLMNLQLAIKGDDIYILEVNPRASRTVPFVGKATHTPWARLAAKVMMGRSLSELGVREAAIVTEGCAEHRASAYAVKESVFPFSKFPGVDVVLGPEMRSTGEVMGIDTSLPVAFAKSQMAAGTHLPTGGAAFVSVKAVDRPKIVEAVRTLANNGFEICATDGTAAHLEKAGIRAAVLKKIDSGTRPNILDLMTDGKIDLVINTPTRTGHLTDEGKIRAATVRLGVAMITTATGANVASQAIAELGRRDWGVKAMQDYRTDHLARSNGSLEPSTRIGAPAVGAAR
ncbi:MAG: carbamoyl-phosphate synthase large subunit [Phycisphaerales bacterium]|nr:carbamoyl-phosphate synthase large subunit [Phycisphaerales bacterium]